MKKFAFLSILLSLILFGCTTKNISSNTQQDPKWVRSLIDDIESKPSGNSPSAIKRCDYQNKLVYYITSPCCDNYNYLYNENNQAICAPDGGITGRGDGKCPDFSLDKNSCELIWQKKTASECTNENDCIASGKCSSGLECTCSKGKCYAGYIAQ